MRLRRVARYCRGCGERLRRVQNRPASYADVSYDPLTGRPMVTEWWWACRFRFWPWADLDKHHPGSRRIPESGARKRLAARP